MRRSYRYFCQSAHVLELADLVYTISDSASYCQHTHTLIMSDGDGSSEGHDTPASSSLSATHDVAGPDVGLMARLDATFDIRPSLREKRRVIDITNRMNHLTPDAIRDGELEWIRYYWTMVNLVVPGEKTLIDPRDAAMPGGVFDGVTRAWDVANFSAAVFIDYFFNPSTELPEYNVNDVDFQYWLAQWRTMGMLPTHAPDEGEFESVPRRDEMAAYKNVRERHNINYEARFFAQTSLTYEILIMWDFNASAAEGENTDPRVSVHNIRFLFDVFDGFPAEFAHLLKVKFVFKDVRQGRYTHDSRTKRYFDNDTRLARSWKLIVRDALREMGTANAARIEAGLGKHSEGYLQAKTDLALEVQRSIHRTWMGDDRVMSRGYLKFFMCDAFKESRRMRRKDDDIRRWLIVV